MRTRSCTLWSRLAAVAAMAGLAVGLGARAAAPVLNVDRDVSGVRITWNAEGALDFVLEASDDFATWTQVNQSIVREEDPANPGSYLYRVFVPASQAANFYRLVNDGRTQAAYVGSKTCAQCHADKYQEFIESGHPFKLNKVVNGEPPKYFSDGKVNVPDTPAGWTWDDVSWVIGGALWKARWIDNDGYIVTGDAVQYNLANGSWVAYHASDPVGTKPYNCGSCHTTGWVSIEDGGVHQDGLPGMWGSFAEPGIGCEACHGPGGRHVATLSKTEIVKDTSSALCGKCHVRGDPATIPASGGFIRHHEQYNEMLSAGHKVLTCVTCHDPHVSARREMPGAIVRECTDCHDPAEYKKPTNFHTQITECETCHMPHASKSAVAVNKYTGDVRTHIFKINPAADGQMFNEDGSLANGATGVTLAYVCYQCHKDPDGVGGTGSVKTLEELSAKATGFHQ